MSITTVCYHINSLSTEITIADNFQNVIQVFKSGPKKQKRSDVGDRKQKAWITFAEH